MTRVHKYILKLKDADKIKREESDKAKAANPFNPKDNKVQVEKICDMRRMAKQRKNCTCGNSEDMNAQARTSSRIP